MLIHVLLKLLVKDKALYSIYFTVEKYVKQGKQNLRVERNQVTADERQTGCWNSEETEDYSRQGRTSTQS